jgi:hypothetical protein
MRMFAFDPGDHRVDYRDHGWVHIRNGLTPEFHAALREFVERRARERRVEGVAVYGEKQQALFEFPPEADFPGELFDAICAVTGLNRPTMTLSERHIKAYDADANPEPPAHKDRYASQVSVGLSIDIPADSELVLYPFDDVSVNPFNISAAYRQSLDPDERPERRLVGAQEVVMDDSGGDVVMFPGHSVWHLRRRSAGAVNLYLKFNDFNSDPLGEDPTTAERHERTLALLADGADLGRAVPVLGRRMDGLAQHYTRDWHELRQVVVWDPDPVPVLLTDAQFRLVRAVDGKRDVQALAKELGVGMDELTDDVRRLALRAALDLLER